jgi:hypothetical protein
MLRSTRRKAEHNAREFTACQIESDWVIVSLDALQKLAMWRGQRQEQLNQ